MKTIKLYYLVCLIALGFTSCSSDDNDDFSNNSGQQESYDLVVKLENAGTLRDLVTDSKVYSIKSLKLEGVLNGTDFAFIREIFSAGGPLETLDIYDCNIIPGGQKIDTCTTTYNVLHLAFFERLKTLKNIRLPKSLTIIEEGAFYQCSSLTNVEIPQGVTFIGYGAFKECTSLISIDIPANVKVVGGDLFGDCSNLNEVRCHAINPPIVKDHWPVKYSATLYVPKGSVELYKETYWGEDFPNIKEM